MSSSPDVSSYVDLTIYDEDPVAILNDILSSARALLPGWQPEAGQIEVVLSEAFANRTAQLAATINRLPSATTEVLLQLFGLTRSDGTKASATIDVNMFASDTLYAGTRFMYYDSNEARSYIFTLDADFTGASGSGLAVTAEAVGAAYNSSTLVGESLVLLTANDNFNSATFATNPSTGADAETDSEYFTRGTTLLASYTTASTTASQIKYYVSANKTYANRVEVYNRRRYRDRDTTATDYGTHDGYALVAVGGNVSTAASATAQVPVSTSNLSDLYDSLTARVASGVTIDVMSAELASVSVTATVVKTSGAVASTVKTAVENAIKAYFDPNQWDWSANTVRQNELISLIDGVSGVDYVSSLTLDGQTLIGTDNIGYYTASGGTAASATLVTAGVTNAIYDPGDLGFYYVDADVATPVVYEFENAESITVTGGIGTGVFVAKANGIGYNDTSNSGNVDAGATYQGTGTVAAALGTATVSSGAITGGSNDSNTFTVLNGTGAVDSDLTVRNLGTLLTYGTLNITVS
jgi:hypothetical protein